MTAEFGSQTKQRTEDRVHPADKRVIDGGGKTVLGETVSQSCLIEPRGFFDSSALCKKRWMRSFM